MGSRREFILRPSQYIKTIAIPKLKRGADDGYLSVTDIDGYAQSGTSANATTRCKSTMDPNPYPIETSHHIFLLFVSGYVRCSLSKASFYEVAGHNCEFITVHDAAIFAQKTETKLEDNR